MFIATVFLIAKRWKQPTVHPGMKGKTKYVITIQWSISLKREGIMIQGSTEINLWTYMFVNASTRQATSLLVRPLVCRKLAVVAVSVALWYVLLGERQRSGSLLPKSQLGNRIMKQSVSQAQAKSEKCRWWTMLTISLGSLSFIFYIWLYHLSPHTYTHTHLFPHFSS